MALTSEQKNEIQILINESLGRAEDNWSKIGWMMKASLEHLTEDRGMPSLIPNHPFVEDGAPKVATFIALVVDMRGSTSHMHSEVKDSSVSGFNRVYYETSALLPALAKVISYEGGSVTEFLGDGVLALFDAGTPMESKVKAAYRAANNCVDDMRNLVNTALADRYKLPAIDLGAGLAYGQAMVTIVGTGINKQPKVLGKCVYEAAKLAGGTNAVIVSSALRTAWPKSEGGSLRFIPKEQKGVEGFRILRK